MTLDFARGLCHGGIVPGPPQNSGLHPERFAPDNVTVLGDRVFTEVMSWISSPVEY